MAKIALNIVKVGMHSSLPNAGLNLLLNFNFEKLLKRETSRTLRLGLKGVKISWNVTKVCIHACSSTRGLHLVKPCHSTFIRGI